MTFSRDEFRLIIRVTYAVVLSERARDISRPRIIDRNEQTL